MTTRKNDPVLRMVITALFAALVCVTTLIIKIPTPGTNGYVNLGDGIILICAFMMHPLYAGAAAGLGSALADLISGYLAYAPGTLIIKGLMAIVGAMIYHSFGKGQKIKDSLPMMIVAGVIAECIMVLGYFFYEAVFLGYGVGAAASILANVGQGVAGILVACLITPLLERNNEVSSLMGNTWKK